MLFSNEIYLMLGEIYLITSSLGIIMISVIYTTELITIGKMLGIQVGVLAISIMIMTSLLYGNMYEVEYFNIGRSFFVNKGSKDILFLVLIGIISISSLGLSYIKINSLKATELFILFLISLMAFIILIFSNDFLSLYMGIELQSLGLYILAALKQNSIYATEAGLKYFILGSVASCLLILGISIIYSFMGLNTFSEIGLFYSNIAELSIVYIGSLIGFILVMISLLFKVGSAPFHIWLPDVYEGVATLVTAFFALLPKLVIFSLIIKLFFVREDLFLIEFNYILLISSLLSITIGSIGALYQKTIKRLLSYSAIGHTGFILIGFTTGNIEGLVSIFFYLIIYYYIIITVFSIVLQIQQKESGVIIKYINNLGYIYKNNKVLGISLVLIFFCLAGIPPLSGFFSKLYLIIATVNQKYFVLVGSLIIGSTVSCMYYLKVIRNIMSIENKKKNHMLVPVNAEGSYIIIGSLILHLIFIIIGGEVGYIGCNLSLKNLY